jgi:hypothetical protein
MDSAGVRYHPPHVPGTVCDYAFDYSAVIPPGTGLTSGTLAVYTNTSPAQPTSDFDLGAVSPHGRRLYCQLSGGIAGNDYQLRWTAADNLGNSWARTTLLLVAQAS